MKSLLTVTRLKGVETQLTRIADCLEAYLSHVHHYNMTAPSPLAEPGDESIEYSDDEKTTLVEAKAFLDSLRIKPVEDEE